jgi:ABC-type xylose transport system substrate-binding protein
MKVTGIIENEDGSATVTFDMTNEEVGQLIQYAVIELLKKGMDEQLCNPPVGNP